MMPMLWNITLQELVLVTDRQTDKKTERQGRSQYCTSE